MQISYFIGSPVDSLPHILLTYWLLLREPGRDGELVPDRLGDSLQLQSVEFHSRTAGANSFATNLLRAQVLLSDTQVWTRIIAGDILESLLHCHCRSLLIDQIFRYQSHYPRFFICTQKTKLVEWLQKNQTLSSICMQGTKLVTSYQHFQHMHARDEIDYPLPNQQFPVQR